MGVPPNKKLPPSKATESPGDYPYIFGSRDTNGAGTITAVDPNKPNESYRSEINHDGSFETREISDEYDGMVTSHSHHERANAGSSSKNNDGNVDSSGQATMNSNVKGDSGSASGGTEYKGNQKSIGGSSESSASLSPGGKVYTLASDDIIESTTKDKHTEIGGKEIKTIGGLSFTMIGGDYGVHTQGEKGVDIQSETKMQMKSASDLLIESDTKITLKCGENTIVIAPDSITITVNKGFFKTVAETTVSIAASGSTAGLYAPKGNAILSGKRNTIKSDAGTKIEKSSAPPTSKVNPG